MTSSRRRFAPLLMGKQIRRQAKPPSEGMVGQAGRPGLIIFLEDLTRVLRDVDSRDAGDQNEWCRRHGANGRLLWPKLLAKSFWPQVLKELRLFPLQSGECLQELEMAADCSPKFWGMTWSREKDAEE